MAIILRVEWRDMPNHESWDDLCAWVCSTMGRERFNANTKVTNEYMDFTLQNEDEVLMFKLRCSHARRLTDNEITVDYVGSLLVG